MHVRTQRNLCNVWWDSITIAALHKMTVLSNKIWEMGVPAKRVKAVTINLVVVERVVHVIQA